MLSGRERVALALDHKEADRVPLDVGGCGATGMHVSLVYKLRQALGLDEPGTPVKVVEPYQMLGEIALDLLEKLGGDVIDLGGDTTMFGFKNEGWRPWTTFDGTPVLVPEGFNTDPEPNGDIFLYPQDDKSAPPSGRMPKGGFYFDAIIRQDPIDESALRVEDNTEEFSLLSDEAVDQIGRWVDDAYNQTDKAILAGFANASFGDIALVPGVALKHPRGIRSIEEWYVSTITRRDFVLKVFERQCEIALANFEKVHKVVGDRIAAVFITGTDFGTQNGPLMSLETYRDLFKPFHGQVNDWVHQHTNWKTFMHCCGSVRDFMDDFIDAGFDVLNPVQCSARNMDPAELKAQFGDRLTFWGGGVDTQKTLPFGTPDDVRNEVRERIETFAPGGGFVFSTIHNIQAGTPTENLVALYEAVREFSSYS